MLCRPLCLMSRMIPLVLLLGHLSLMLLVPLPMRGLLVLVPRLMLRLPLIRRATSTVALAASTTVAASASLAPPALATASGFETSGQGMATVSPV